MLSDGVLIGAGGDEDEHDIASVTLAAIAASAPLALAFTGIESTTPIGIAMILILMGLIALAVSRRRKGLVG